MLGPAHAPSSAAAAALHRRGSAKGCGACCPQHARRWRGQAAGRLLLQQARQRRRQAARRLLLQQVRRRRRQAAGRLLLEQARRLRRQVAGRLLLQQRRDVAAAAAWQRSRPAAGAWQQVMPSAGHWCSLVQGGCGWSVDLVGGVLLAARTCGSSGGQQQRQQQRHAQRSQWGARALCAQGRISTCCRCCHMMQVVHDWADSCVRLSFLSKAQQGQVPVAHLQMPQHCSGAAAQAPHAAAAAAPAGVQQEQTAPPGSVPPPAPVCRFLRSPAFLFVGLSAPHFAGTRCRECLAGVLQELSPQVDQRDRPACGACHRVLLQ